MKPTNRARGAWTLACALAIAAAAGSQASAQVATCSAAAAVNQIWTATLVTGQLDYGTDTLYGFYDWGGTQFGTLDNRSVTYGNIRGFAGTTRIIKNLMQGTWFSRRSMFLGFIDDTFGLRPNLVLHVGEDAYNFSDASTGAASYDWAIGDRTQWGDGETICVALTDASPPPPAVAPDAPANLSAIAGDGQITLSWEVQWHGYSAITGHQYRVRAGDDEFGEWTDIGDSTVGAANASGFTLTGLANDTTYTFAVRAKNAIDPSEASNEASATPNNHTTPGAPRSPSVSSGDGKLTVQWAPPASDGNTPIMRYEYRLWDAGANNAWTTIPDSAPGGANHGRYAIARPNGTYTNIYLRAVNAEGASPNVHRGATTFSNAPGAPSNFRAERPYEDRVTLSWTEPTPASGVTITAYIVDRSPDGQTAWSTYTTPTRGTTSLKVEGSNIADRPYYRIRTQFRANTPVVIDGQSLRWGMSATSPIIQIPEAPVFTDPTIRISDASGNEGRDSAVSFTVKLKPVATGTVTVAYQTEDGTATAGSDYTATSGTLTFAAGDTRKTVSVPITDDEVEDSGETFTLKLSNASGATLGDTQARGTIYNEDHALAGLTLVKSADNSEVATLTDDTTVMLDSPSTGHYNVRATLLAASTADSVQFALSGAKTAQRTDTSAPYTVFDDEGEGLAAGTYTVQATAYAGAEALHTISATFKIAETNGYEGESTTLSASFPTTTATATEHTGTDDRPEVIVAFSEAVQTIAASTPSATVTGGTVSAVRRHTEAGLANAWAFVIDSDGDDDVTFTLTAGAACASAGVCTSDGTTLTAVPGTGLTISGPEQGDTETTGLTATFADMPSHHDGTTPFTFKLTFSEAPDVGYARIRDHAFTVTNGNVTSASRATPPSNLEWRVTVKPAGANDMTITLKTTTDCDASSAICTSGDAALGSVPDAVTIASGTEPEVVANSALTASFANVPAEHGGGGEANRFTFDLAFSRNPEVGYAKLRDRAFTITGGEVKRAQRKVRGSNQSWTITVEPTGWGKVSLTLPGERACTATGAICTADNVQLANSPSATIEGPAALSVADATAQENTDDTLEFAVTLDRASTLTVTVDYATSDGTASAGADYTATSGRLTFDPGDIARTVSVPVLNDAIDDGGETMTLRLSNAENARIADATATGTIENSDPLQQAWIARFGRTVASDVVEGITDRLATARSGSEARIAGVTIKRNGSTWTEAPVDDETRLDDSLESERTLTGQELLMQSAFRLQSEADAPGGTAWTAWGRFSSSAFEGETEGVALSGNVTTGLLGADIGTDDWIAGVALSAAKGDGPFALTGDKPSSRKSGTVDSALTSVHPYAQIQATDQIALWAIGGYGAGDMTIAQDGDTPIKTDIDMTMAALGARGTVLDTGAGDALDMTLRTDALWLKTTSDATADMMAAKADVTRLRLIIDASRGFEVGMDGTLTPRIEAGIRRDAGDAEEGTGLELGAGLSYQRAGITIEGNVRTLIAHDDDAYEEWGASGSVRVDPGSDGRGLSLTVTPTWGSAASEAEQLWSARDATGLVRNNEIEAERRLDAELGYGLGAANGLGVVTPYAGLTLGDRTERTLRTGLRWNASQSATVALEAAREGASAENPPTNALMLRASLRF